MGRQKAPIKIGMRQRMKVPYYEDLANHIGPEPHGGCGNAMAEAWVGESVGGTWSSEINAIRVPTLLSGGEGKICHSDIASYDRTRRSLSTLACVDTSCAGIGRSGRNPVSKKLEWENPADKNLLVHRGALPLVASEEHETGAQIPGGTEKEQSVRPSHNGSRKSDNNIVPRKQANKRICRPQRSLWREGR